jgi:CheY-like chemotaxis protein
MNPNLTRILIADDDRDGADTMADLLRYAGYEARAVYDGLQAVEAASRFEPRVAILDIEMPAMDGYATARALRDWAADRRLLLIIAHTGIDRLPEAGRARDLGFDRVLSKPASSKRLLETIETALSSGSQSC